MVAPVNELSELIKRSDGTTGVPGDVSCGVAQPEPLAVEGGVCEVGPHFFEIKKKFY